jgi:hypothetical protein
MKWNSVICWPSRVRREQSGVLAALVLAAFVAPPDSAAAQSPDREPAIKMSRSGICHEFGSVHYQQTIYFQAFESIDACLAAGGRKMGAEYEENAPQFEYQGNHPPRCYWTRVFVVFFVALVVYLGIILPLWRRWKTKRTYRTFADSQRRRWEGHKLESKRPRK